MFEYIEWKLTSWRHWRHLSYGQLLPVLFRPTSAAAVLSSGTELCRESSGTGRRELAACRSGPVQPVLRGEGTARPLWLRPSQPQSVHAPAVRQVGKEHPNQDQQVQRQLLPARHQTTDLPQPPLRSPQPGDPLMSNHVQQNIAERTLCIILEGEMLVEITLQVEADRPIRKMAPVSQFSFNIFKHSFNIFEVNFLNGMLYIVTKMIGWIKRGQFSTGIGIKTFTASNRVSSIHSVTITKLTSAVLRNFEGSSWRKYGRPLRMTAPFVWLEFC